MVPFGGGVLLGVAAVWILPEMAEFFGWPAALAWTAAGFALLWFVDRYLHPVCPACSPGHEHDDCATRLHGFATPLLIAAGRLRADLSPDRILEFLLLNRDFPHAIRYCVDGIRHAIESIQRTGGRRPPDELAAVIGRLHAMLGYTNIAEILAGDTAAFLHSIREQSMRIHELIYRYYVHYSIQSALAI